jgi:hypothetical protein
LPVSIKASSSKRTALCCLKTKPTNESQIIADGRSRCPGKLSYSIDLMSAEKVGKP